MIRSWVGRARAGTMKLRDSAAVARLSAFLIVGGVVLAVLAQRSFAAPHLSKTALALFSLGIAVAATVIVAWLPLGGPNERRAEPEADGATLAGKTRVALRAVLAMGGLAFAYLAFREAGDNSFTGPGLAFWLLGMLAFVAASWEYGDRPGLDALRAVVPGRTRPSAKSMLLLAGVVTAVGAAAFFRVYRLDGVPPELGPDTLVNVLDARATLDGAGRIYYVGSDGAGFVYVTAAISAVLRLPVDFLTVKLAGALAGVLAVLFTYLMAKEAFSSRAIGLLAAFLMAPAHWAVVNSRAGMRNSFAALCVALVFWLMLRALKHGRRNDFLLLGLAIGLSLYNYTAVRVLPVVVLASLLLTFASNWLFSGPDGRRRNASLARNSLVLVGAALTVVAPLAGYAKDHSDDYWAPWLDAGPNAADMSFGATLTTLLGNVKEAALMFNWIGDIVVSQNIPFSPALDDITAVLLPLGLVIVVLTWLRRPGLVPLYLLAGFAALMGPTILALADVGDNPSFARASGAMPFVYAFAAVPVYHGAVLLRRAGGPRAGRWLAAGAVIVLLVAVSTANYRWYFDDYEPVVRELTFNHTEVARVIEDFGQTGGRVEDAYLIGFTHWMDWRAIAVELGDRDWENGLARLDDGLVESLQPHLAQPGVKLYVLHQADAGSIELLETLYPAGAWRVYRSRYGEAHDFVVFRTLGSLPEVRASP